jgi:hypothetical protein
MSETKGERLTVKGRERMAVVVAVLAATAAGAAAREGGYRPTREQWASLSRAIRIAAHALVEQVDDEWTATTDAQVEAAAQDLGRTLVRRMFGPAPLAQ